MRIVQKAVLVIFGIALFWSASPARADDRALVESLVPQIESRLDPAVLSSAKEALAEQPDPAIAPPVMGMAMMLQGKSVPAAWFFAQDALNHPDGPAPRSNLGVALQAAAGAGESPATDAKWVDAGYALLRSARMAAPDNAIVNANYGEALLEQWRQKSNTDGLENAVAALRHAIERDPDNPFARAHLAEALLAIGDAEAARQAFNEAQTRWSMHPAVIAAARRSPGITGAGNASPMPQCDHLDVVAMCKETCKCTSIVGCLNFVTCTMSNSDFINACRAGAPIPTAYNCEAEFPKFGIQLPGLQSGFTIVGPGFKVNVGPDGKGGYKWEIKLGNKAFVVVGGSIDPKTGAISGTDVKTGVNITFIPGKGDFGDLINKYGINPSTLSIDNDPKKPIKVDAYDDVSGIFIQK